jgi:hypothetical protein
MKAFVIHVTDIGAIDERITVEVPDRMDLGRAAQLALDEIAEHHGCEISLPVFIDIHPHVPADVPEPVAASG